jgi:hypothetical protein
MAHMFFAWMSLSVAAFKDGSTLIWLYRLAVFVVGTRVWDLYLPGSIGMILI